MNGAAKFTAQLAAGLTERGHVVTVVAPAASSSDLGLGTEQHEGVIFSVHRLKSWRWPPHPWLRFALPWRINRNSARILDDLQPDIVHYQSHLVVGRGLTNEAVKRRIPIIGTNHLMPDNLLEFTVIPVRLRPFIVRGVWRSARRSFLRSDAVTTPTTRAADYLTEHIGLSDVKAISCGVKLPDYDPDVTHSASREIIFVGRITKEKRIDVLLSAFAMIPAQLSASLTIVGIGEERHALERRAEMLGIADRVSFLGYAPATALQGRLANAALFVMPSVAELQSIATLEAMASGLPIVGANAMALPHLVHHGENGYLFSPDDPSDLAFQIARVLDLPEPEYLRMKRNSVSLAQKHDLKHTIDQFEQLYRQTHKTRSVNERRRDLPSKRPTEKRSSLANRLLR